MVRGSVTSRSNRKYANST
uniref:Uncharacterized protein n=1 Tax=Anguilla anguilla TaxID=7936 RepID=A0A0E9TKH5_ANGAN